MLKCYSTSAAGAPACSNSITVCPMKSCKLPALAPFPLALYTATMLSAAPLPYLNIMGNWLNGQSSIRNLTGR